ncbi:MAG: hypothetical protein M1824_001395 [Vezdaea acicularis]|nr:MAG: hypothetical protein M1824_001395 [Vezdaea acicularis]
MDTINEADVIRAISEIKAWSGTFTVSDLNQSICERASEYTEIPGTSHKRLIRKTCDMLVPLGYLSKESRLEYKPTEKFHGLIREEASEQSSDNFPDRQALYAAVLRRIEAIRVCPDVESTTPRTPGTLKRRSSMKLVKGMEESGNEGEGSDTITVTPRKLKKRVRFSDPGPKIVSSSSTGLTPAVQRCSVTAGLLSAAPRRPFRSSHRRRTFPLTLESSETIPSGTVQFVPLRQILDRRVRRRLSRNGLSEEINGIDAANREATMARRKELQDIKEQMRLKDLEVQRLKEELEIARQLGIPADTASQNHDSLRITGLEEELQVLRESMREHEEHSNQSPTISALESEREVQVSFGNDSSFMADDFDANVTDIRESESGALQVAASVSKSASTQTTYSPRSDTEKLTLKSTVGTLQSSLQTLTASLEKLTSMHDRLLSKIQPHLPEDLSSQISDVDSALDIVLTTLTLAQSDVSETNTTLSALRTEVQSLGFPGVSTDEMLSSITSQFRDARLELEYLLPGETPTGFSNPALLTLLLDRTRDLLQKVQDRDALLETQRSRDEALYAQINAKSATIDQLTRQVHELEAETSTQEASLTKLKTALGGYREEVRGLETLITKLDTAAKATTHKTTSTVSDLKAQLRTSRVRAAELEESLKRSTASSATAEARLHSLLAERDAALASVQAEAQKREIAHGQNLALRDARILGLRKEGEDLEDALAEVRERVVALGKEKVGLLRKVKRERERGEKAVREMRGVMEGWEREREERGVGSASGLLTPTSRDGGGERFVESRLKCMVDTPTRGKGRGRGRKVDSGIGVVSEGEEEDEGDVEIDMDKVMAD